MKNKVATKTVNTDGSVAFNFANQESRTLSLDMFSAAIQARLIGYGLSQKFGDAYSGAKGDVEAAIEAFDKLVENLSGDDATWIARVSGGGVAKRSTLIVEAISRYKNCDADAAMEVVDALDAEQLKAVRATSAIQLLITTIKAERAAEKAEKATAGDDGALDLI